MLGRIIGVLNLNFSSFLLLALSAGTTVFVLSLPLGLRTLGDDLIDLDIFCKGTTRAGEGTAALLEGGGIVLLGVGGGIIMVGRSLVVLLYWSTREGVAAII